jgi:hypothetical protein
VQLSIENESYRDYEKKHMNLVAVVKRYKNETFANIFRSAATKIRSSLPYCHKDFSIFFFSHFKSTKILSNFLRRRTFVYKFQTVAFSSVFTLAP